MKPTFDDGVIWAIARIVELHDEPTIAASVARENGFSYSTLRGLADEADLKFIDKLKGESTLKIGGISPGGEE